MAERLERLLTEAIRNDRPVLVNPTEDEIRAAADRLRSEGRLICTRCRKAIEEANFVTRRIEFGPRLQAIAHLHPGCSEGLVPDRAESEGEAGEIAQ
ncbi:MAG: hypothetical protein ACOY93_15335 [Bacillota bacterium]